jgi:hypothetical protein
MRVPYRALSGFTAVSVYGAIVMIVEKTWVNLNPP